MAEHRGLKKVDANLYLEPCKRQDGTDFDIKWQKHFEHIRLDLIEIKLVRFFSASIPAFDDRYEQKEQCYIEAKGQLPGSDSLGLITRDGVAKSRLFTEIRVRLDRMEGDMTEADIATTQGHGRMDHYEEDGEVSLAVAMPATLFDRTYQTLQEGHHTEVRLSVYVDVFDSEVARFLGDVGVSRHFFIEHGSSRNQSYFSGLRIAASCVSAPGHTVATWQEHAEEEQATRAKYLTLFTTIAANMVQVRWLFVVILVLMALRIFKFF